MKMVLVCIVIVIAATASRADEFDCSLKERALLDGEGLIRTSYNYRASERFVLDTRAATIKGYQAFELPWPWKVLYDGRNGTTFQMLNSEDGHRPSLLLTMYGAAKSGLRPFAVQVLDSDVSITSGLCQAK